MKKSIILSLIVFTALHLQLFAQSKNTIQINGGLMSAIDSHHGLLGSIQYNYKINNNFTVYSYTGFIYWNNNIVNFSLFQPGQIPAQKLVKTFSEDNHRMIPLYIGGRYFFYNSSVFRPFVSLELGINYLSFNSYNLQKVTNPDGSESVLQGPKTSENETLLGAGAGLGACHDIGDNLELQLEFRFNTLKNSNYDWFNAGRTLRTFLFGFAYKI